MSQVIEKEPVIMPNAPEPPTPGNDHRPPQTRGQKLLRWLMGPVGVTVLVFVIFVALLGYGFAVLVNTGLQSSQSSGTSTGMQMNPTATPSNVPNATQNYGAQPAQYAVAADGTKVFHFTAEQVMWEPVHGHPRVLAWTLDGTVPGPTIRVTAGDHLRISITNHFPEATTLHWHGLEIPANQDGVPGVGQDPIKPGQTYTYDFTVPLDNGEVIGVGLARLDGVLPHPWHTVLVGARPHQAGPDLHL